jgi:hypothetical protein
MLIDIVPPWAMFFISLALVMIAVEVGFRVGLIVRKKASNEREPPVSAIAGAILSLQAFMLAFTFGIVSDRYDTKKELAREDANVVRSAWQRSDFLSEPDRTESKTLLRQYVDLSVTFSMSAHPEKGKEELAEGQRIQHRLWAIAVEHRLTDLNSDIGSLYVQSLNEMASMQGTRYNLGIEARIPTAIWFALLCLLILGMVAVGYHTAIAESRRPRITTALAISFSLVIAIIAVLDHPLNNVISVSQLPMISLQNEMNTTPDSPIAP